LGRHGQMVRSQQRQNGRRGTRSSEARDLADVVQDPLSVAVKRPGDVMRGPSMLDVHQAPLAGKRPGDFRLPHPVRTTRSDVERSSSRASSSTRTVGKVGDPRAAVRHLDCGQSKPTADPLPAVVSRHIDKNCPYETDCPFQARRRPCAPSTKVPPDIWIGRGARCRWFGLPSWSVG
jgi:hypothetical protein